MKKFNDLGLAEPLLRALAAQEFSAPTPIQNDVIPAMLAGEDILGIAQTGTGKTAAFVLPLLHRLTEQRSKTENKRCGALILAPTRELAQQIAFHIRSLSKFMSVSVAIVVGGAKPGPQIRSLAKGADIVVATPGRLLDHMNTGAVHLDRTTTVILDEADQMLDLGFMPAIRKILSSMPKSRQTVMMSATMPPPIRTLARDFQNKPREIAVAAQSTPIERIAQSVRHTSAATKLGVLSDILSGAGAERTIVFTRTKRGADKVSRHLDKAGFSAAAIHGNKSQPQRERTLASFRSGKTIILVATDIAARGIDIHDVSHVINYELPEVAEAYVHRIGRTARAGKNGIAISLCDPAERSRLRDIERLIGSKLAQEGELANLPSQKPATRKTRSHATPVKTAEPAPHQQRPVNTKKKRQSREKLQSDRSIVVTTGTVKWFNGAKGYGFIAPDAGGRDVFVHSSAVQRAGLTGLNQGDKIGYDLQSEGSRGKPAAVNLQPR